MNLSKSIETFNSGNWDRIEPIFGNIQNFMNYLKSKGKLNLIDYRSMYDTLTGYDFNEASIILLKELENKQMDTVIVVIVIPVITVNIILFNILFRKKYIMSLYCYTFFKKVYKVY